MERVNIGELHVVWKGLIIGELHVGFGLHVKVTPQVTSKMVHAI